MTTKHSSRALRRAAGSALLATTVALGAAGQAAAVATSVTVSPDTKLPDTATVNVSGTGFYPMSELEIYQCVDVPNGEQCSQDVVGAAFTNANGDFSTTATVRAVFVAEGGASTECRTGCRVVVRLGALGAQDAISFARYSSSK